MSTSLINNLGGNAGFGENFLDRNDDSYTGYLDLRSVFGTQGINFFGREYTGFYLNNNGSITFASATGTYTPSAITGSTSNPIIAAYWADVDTRAGIVGPTQGGTSTGSNLLWYDFDPANRTFTATWDDVGYYSHGTDKLNAFQISITQIGTSGDFDIVFRYENVDWTTGSASGGAGGLGGVPARAGYSSGNGVDFFELPQSGNQTALLDLENASNVGVAGTYVFNVRSGSATPAISVGDASLAEGNGPNSKYIVVPVFLAAPSGETITVQYATSDGTAVAGQDYVTQGGLLTFAPGVTQQNLFIELIGDTAIEGNETFGIQLFNSTGAPIADANGTATIVNDDGIVISDVSVMEGTSGSPTIFTFTVSLLTAATSPVTVDYATAAGSAASGTDFSPTNGTLAFAAGETSKTIAIEVSADALSEADETFTVNLSGASGATIADAIGTGTIRNDDGLVIDDLAVIEGTSATPTSAAVTIRLLTPATTPVSVDWATAPGTATTPADFSTSNGTVTFAVGETVKTVIVPVTGDSLIEGTEAFQVVLSNATGTAIVDGTGEVRIADDDGFSVSTAVAAEGNAGTTALTFTVTLGSALSQTATVDFATVDGTATAGTDYVGATGTVTFLAGEVSKTVTVAVNGDLSPEDNETMTLNLSNPSVGAGIRQGSATGTIFNDDGFSVGDASLTEGNSGTSTVLVTITLSAPAAGPVTVNYTTQDGTALAGVDYVATGGTLTFAAGETSKTIEVTINGDTQFEGNETFRVLLSSPNGSALVDSSATVSINNDDTRPPPSFRIVDVGQVEGTGDGTSILRFQVALSEVATTDSSVDYATAAGTASADVDYTTAAGTLIIPAGSLFGFIDVVMNRDTAIEANETFSVILSNPSAGTAIAANTATGTIFNDDVSVSIVATSANKAEGHSGSTGFTFTVTRTGDTEWTQDANWVVSGSGVNGADFTGGALPTGTVSFAPGETTKVITVNVAGDTVVENNESFAVTLSDPTEDITFATARATGTIRNDDASLSIAATSADKAEGQSGTTPFTFTVTRSGQTTTTHNVNWAVSSADASAADFEGSVLPSGTLTFAAGETSKVITVNVVGEALLEADEGFTVTLSNPSAGATIGTAAANATIRNDDASLSIAATVADTAEGQSGTTPFTFTVTRSGDLASTSTADWSVSGAAVNGADFAGGILPAGTVSFAAGETSKLITVNVAGDTLAEGNERFTVSLLNPGAGTAIARSSAIATIRNDDASNGHNPLTGTAGQDYIDGLSGNDSIFGLGGVDLLLGRDGNDILDGGAGDDVMIGGAGNDRYYVDQAGDFVIEVDALHGNDSVFTTVTYSLSQHVENMTLLGTLAIDATGNDGNNRLVGNRAANQLNGGAGDDVLEGAGGDDTLDGGGGTDVASYASAQVGVTVNLASVGPQNTIGAGSDTLFGIENLTGSSFDDTLLGDSLTNALLGGAGNDQLMGGDGDDLVDGGTGNDQLNGGNGADTFAFSAPLLPGNVDTVVDFDVAVDLIQLENSVFTAFSTAWGVEEAAFGTGTAATTADMHLIFNVTDGALLYDADGMGGQAAVQFATLQGVVGDLTAGHFLIV
ncbi:Calx-beta domain-containing protein [Reyranella sp.]|uniref:beta strand repeat-containing protein n=1 Tax=Reyranella sp. TaxID=1929291 RepID=UPI002723690B|nr:Calx-beta domain-containing protein [Reyranella sp.]MDO8973127.1 Calx-beta domain-containing protein [Reyranella sp.]